MAYKRNKKVFKFKRPFQYSHPVEGEGLGGGGGGVGEGVFSNRMHFFGFRRAYKLRVGLITGILRSGLKNG